MTADKIAMMEKNIDFNRYIRARKLVIYNQMPGRQHFVPRLQQEVDALDNKYPDFASVYASNEARKERRATS